MAKLIHEGMDAAESQDLVDARPPKYPESGSDGEEEEELEPLGGEDSCPNTSPCGMGRSGAPKCTRDEAEPESAKRLRGEGSEAPGVIGDVPRDDDCTLPPGRGGADGPPSSVVMTVVMSSPRTSSAETIPTKTAART